MKISVVVPILIKNNKHLSMTNKCISMARENTSIHFELIIVETASEYFYDKADVYIHEKEITTPEISHNRGFLVASRSDYIVLLTNDVYPRIGWLESLLKVFHVKHDAGLSTIGNSRIHVEKDEIIEDFWFDIAMIKKEIFDKCGYYDERFIGSWCDTDLLIRAYKQGYKMYRNLSSVVDIEGTQTTVGMNENHHKNYLRGQELFRYKHEGCGLPIYEVVK